MLLSNIVAHNTVNLYKLKFEQILKWIKHPLKRYLEVVSSKLKHGSFVFPQMKNVFQTCQWIWTYPGRPRLETVWSLESTRSGSCQGCWCSWRCVGTSCLHCCIHQYLRRKRNSRFRLNTCQVKETLRSLLTGSPLLWQTNGLFHVWNNWIYTYNYPWQQNQP